LCINLNASDSLPQNYNFQRETVNDLYLSDVTTTTDTDTQFFTGFKNSNFDFLTTNQAEQNDAKVSVFKINCFCEFFQKVQRCFIFKKSHA
jgi:hypothetical protein